MYEFLVKPEDLLFFRDARPMASGEGYGYGCNMPYPDRLYSALRTALLRQSETMPSGKSESKHYGVKNKNREGKQRKFGSDAYGSLKTIGPFPYHTEYGCLFSIPKDVLKIDINKIFKTRLEKHEQQDNTVNAWSPKFLPVSTVAATKDKHKGFWTGKQMQTYLNGERCDFSPVPTEKVWKDEWRTGVEINPETNSSKDGQLFAASYLRLEENAGFVFGASLTEDKELLMIEKIQFGGERRLAIIEKKERLLPDFEFKKAEKEGVFILKWILLTPAIFAYGAVPGWCLDSRKNIPEPEKSSPGKVCLKINGDAELIACSVGEQKPVSGWDLLEGGAKPTLYAVQPGAVYYFRCDSANSANSLADKLHWKPRSDILGEKGFGYGICSIEKSLL